MKYDLKNNKYFRWGLTAFLTIAASICFYYLLFQGHNKNIMTLLKVCHVISRNGFEQWETA